MTEKEEAFTSHLSSTALTCNEKCSEVEEVVKGLRWQWFDRSFIRSIGKTSADADADAAAASSSIGSTGSIGENSMKV